MKMNVLPLSTTNVKSVTIIVRHVKMFLAFAAASSAIINVLSNNAHFHAHHALGANIIAPRATIDCVNSCSSSHLSNAPLAQASR